MTKLQKNYWNDILLILSGLVCVISGYLIDFKLGGRAAVGLYKPVHTYSAYIMTISMVLHFFWHWSWLRQVTKQIFSRTAAKKADSE